MAGPSSVLRDLSHDPKTTDLEFVIHRFNQYAALNAEDYRLWNCIQMDFRKFEAEHFDELDNATLRVFRDYCYPHGFWIDLNLGLDKTCNTAMLEAVAAEWNNKWTLEQIEWVEERYHSLSRATRKRKQELTGIPHLDSASNPELNTAGQGTQQYQDMGYQTPPQQPAVEPISYPTVIKPSPYLYLPHQSQLPYQQDAPAAPITTSFNKPLTALDVGRYNIRNRRNDHQPAPTPVSNPVPYRPTSKIRDDCKCIPKRSTAPTLSIQAPPAQAPLVQALPRQASQRQVPRIQALSVSAPLTPIPPTQQAPLTKATPIQAPLIQAPPAQVPPTQAFSASAPSVSIKHDRGQPKEHPKPINIASPSDICFVMDKLDVFCNKEADSQLPQYTASEQKVVTPGESPSNARVFNPGFVDEIQNPGTDKAYEKSRLVEQAHNEKDKETRADTVADNATGIHSINLRL
ncbi:hypothetical protein MMC31_004449 [Peltigera leucophlebia]|nr:hypothetical protein [Peltigera leucophlebia]